MRTRGGARFLLLFVGVGLASCAESTHNWSELVMEATDRRHSQRRRRPSLRYLSLSAGLRTMAPLRSSHN